MMWTIARVYELDEVNLLGYYWFENWAPLTGLYRTLPSPPRDRPRTHHPSLACLDFDQSSGAAFLETVYATA